MADTRPVEHPGRWPTLFPEYSAVDDNQGEIVCSKREVALAREHILQVERERYDIAKDLARMATDKGLVESQLRRVKEENERLRNGELVSQRVARLEQENAELKAERDIAIRSFEQLQDNYDLSLDQNIAYKQENAELVKGKLKLHKELLAVRDNPLTNVILRREIEKLKAREVELVAYAVHRTLKGDDDKAMNLVMALDDAKR